MKNIRQLIWLTQLGISTAAPLAGFILLAVWLYKCMHWGAWVIVAGIVLGLVGAADGLRMTLKAMDRTAKEKSQKPLPGFNEHE